VSHGIPTFMGVQKGNGGAGRKNPLTIESTTGPSTFELSLVHLQRPTCNTFFLCPENL